MVFVFQIGVAPVLVNPSLYGIAVETLDRNSIRNKNDEAPRIDQSKVDHFVREYSDHVFEQMISQALGVVRVHPESAFKDSLLVDVAIRQARVTRPSQSGDIFTKQTIVSLIDSISN